MTKKRIHLKSGKSVKSYKYLDKFFAQEAPTEAYRQRFCDNHRKNFVSSPFLPREKSKHGHIWINHRRPNCPPLHSSVKSLNFEPLIVKKRFCNRGNNIWHKTMESLDANCFRL